MGTIKLDFIYDHELAKFTEGKLEQEDIVVTSVSAMNINNSTGTTQSLNNLPPSPASQDLDLKIQSVRTFWDIGRPSSLPMGFDQG